MLLTGACCAAQESGRLDVGARASGVGPEACIHVLGRLQHSAGHGGTGPADGRRAILQLAVSSRS